MFMLRSISEDNKFIPNQNNETLIECNKRFRFDFNLWSKRNNSRQAANQIESIKQRSARFIAFLWFRCWHSIIETNFILVFTFHLSLSLFFVLSFSLVHWLELFFKNHHHQATINDCCWCRWIFILHDCTNHSSNLVNQTQGFYQTYI